MNIAEAIKKCALDAYNAALPCEVCVGSVVCEDPIEIKCGEFCLSGDLLDVCDHLLKKECSFKYAGTEKVIVVNEGIKKGDEVVLMRKNGGVGYVAIGKM